MSRKQSNINVDYVIKLYQSGRSIRDISNIVHTRAERIKRILIDNNIDIRIPRNAKIENIDVNSVVSLYNSGISEYAISKEFGVSRSVIRRILLESGVIIRGCSEANKLSASRRSNSSQEGYHPSSKVHRIQKSL